MLYVRASAAEILLAVKKSLGSQKQFELQVLGIIGALDPHTHKLNQADLQGEGKLEAEGVRPQRPPTYHHTGEGGARTFGKPTSISSIMSLA